MTLPGPEPDAYDLQRCRFERKCTTRTPAGPGPGSGRGLCPPDEVQGAHAIEQLPRLHAELVARSAKDAGRPVGGRIGGGQATEASIPLLLDMDAAAREITWTMQVWATRVARVLRGPERSLADVARWQPPYTGGLLINAFPVLRSLRPGWYPPYVRDGEGRATPVQDDGPGGIVQLTALYRRSASILGETQRQEARHLPCPAPIPAPADTPDAAPGGGCGQDGTLVRQIGREGVYCTQCGWHCTDTEYDRYALTFVPPPARRRIERDAGDWWGAR